jgi:transketolase
MENLGKVEYVIRKAHVKLLEIKDTEIRIMTLKQASEAVDKNIHMGGAASATIPLVSLFYGGIMQLDVANPTRRGQDVFVLSKGHSVAPMASIYADLGYFDRSVLKNSRSRESILNGHPGPILPGVHISTGPLGQGLSVAEGFALVGKKSPNFDVFCMTGDGELQEGYTWEAIMYSSHKRLDNLCVIVDKNSGQLDDTKQLIFPLLELDKRFAAFGWRAVNVDATQYSPVLAALQTFKFSPREGRPTVIICRTRKGSGAFSSLMVGHKVDIADSMAEQEMTLLKHMRSDQESEFLGFFNELQSKGEEGRIRERLLTIAKEMNLEIFSRGGEAKEVRPIIVSVKTKPAAPRNKKIDCEVNHLPRLDKSKEYSSSSVISTAMKVFARDPRVVSIDADLASTSGLEEGVGFVDKGRAFNVGVAEPNMMCIGEAFAAMGYNTWISTFCPFFDWRVLRRIAIGYQERLEAIQMKGGWLTEGHGLDLTLLATAPNFETRTNGATHMGNDDTLVFDGIAHLKIIDTSCPQQVLGAMKWVMEGNKGMVYIRIMRAASAVIYGPDFIFEYGKGYVVQEGPNDRAVIISSGRGVHEALAAAKELEKSGIRVAVVDMPSIDEKLLLNLYDSGKLMIIAEQNNGYIWSRCREVLFRSKKGIDPSRIMPINVLDKHGRPQFIHSATYPQLLEQFGLAPHQLAGTIQKTLPSWEKRRVKDL